MKKKIVIAVILMFLLVSIVNATQNKIEDKNESPLFKIRKNRATEALLKEKILINFIQGRLYFRPIVLNEHDFDLIIYDEEDNSIITSVCTTDFKGCVIKKVLSIHPICMTIGVINC